MADGFVIRNWEDLTASMVSWIQGNPDVADGLLSTDLTVGSLERSHLEAVALLMEEYDVRASQSMRWAIQESCLRAFGFQPLPAVSALGQVVFQCLLAPTAPLTIAAGTKLVATNGMQFATTAPVTIAIGALVSAPVQVQAATPGPDGNVAAGTITRILSPIPGVDAVTNSGAATGGANAEGDADRLSRFQRYIRTLQRGTLASLEFAASTVSGVVQAKALDPFLLVPVPSGVPYAGLSWVIIDDGANTGVLNPTIASQVSNVLHGTPGNPGWIAAGTRVDILPVEPIPVKVRAAVQVAPTGYARWADIQTALTAAATTFFQALNIGDTVSYQNLVVALSLCDPDILEVELVQWLSTDSVPGFGASISANDLQPADPANLFGNSNCRATLFSTSADGVTYPYWYQP